MDDKRILIVDDEEDLLMALEIKLSSWGYDILTANNGKEALKLIKKDPPDAVVLDIMMPEMDGIETLKKIRKFNTEIPVLMFTAHGDDKKVKFSDSLGIAGFIHKGIADQDSSEAIHTILRGVLKKKK